MNLKRLKNYIIAVAVIAIVTTIVITASYICGKVKESNANWRLSSKLVNSPIPEDAKVIRSSDTHGGLHGDGEYFVVFQLTENQYIYFLENVSYNKRWMDLPMSKDLNKFIFGERKSLEKYEGHGENKIPKITRHGKYYFHDKFVEQYPQNKGTSILDRPSCNFVFGLLDSENKRLYIMEYDS